MAKRITRPPLWRDTGWRAINRWGDGESVPVLRRGSKLRIELHVNSEELIDSITMHCPSGVLTVQVIPPVQCWLDLTVRLELPVPFTEKWSDV